MKFLKTKYFTPIVLLIFFMPFLRMCESNKVIKTKENKKENITEVITEKGSGFYVGDEINLNAYQLGFGFVENIYSNEFQFNNFLKDKEFFSIISYTFIIIFSILMIVFSWLKKILWVRNLVITNIFLLIISTILLIKSKFIDEFSDVKYGFYVFLMYSILIIYISNKENLELKKNLNP